MLNVTSPPHAPSALGPSSQAVAANGFLFTSGQIGLVPESVAVAGDTIEAQAEQACRNVQAILEANGIGFDRVVKTTCFLADMNDFAAFNAVYARYFVNNPARSCVAVRTLPKGLLCEIEAVAVL